MALKPLNHQMTCLSFDGLDADLTTLKGGEVVGLTYVTGQQFSGTDKAAADVADGYVSDTRHTRPAVTKTLTSGMRPLFLCDDGQSGYGTLFGTLVGGSTGQVVSGGTVLGPHSTLGSGKVSCWEDPGLFAVTLDAVDTTATTGFAQTNPTLAGNAACYATTSGILTPNVGLAFESIVVGRFIEFSNGGTRVATPASLVSAANLSFSQMIFHFYLET